MTNLIDDLDLFARERDHNRRRINIFFTNIWISRRLVTGTPSFGQRIKTFFNSIRRFPLAFPTNKFSVVKRDMLRKRKYFKVFNSVIQFISIYMMDGFMFVKFPPKIFFHNKTMCPNRAFPSRMGKMITIPNRACATWSYCKKIWITMIKKSLIMQRTKMFCKDFFRTIFNGTNSLSRPSFPIWTFFIKRMPLSKPFFFHHKNNNIYNVARQITI